METKRFTESEIIYAVATFNADPFCVEDSEQIADVMAAIDQFGAEEVIEDDEREVALARLDLPADSRRIVYRAGYGDTGCLFSMEGDEYEEKSLADIADENDLEVVKTTCLRNGYPSNLCKAVVGFKSFEDAERIASENGLTLIWIDARDGWQLWYRGDTASEPMKITSDDFGDDFNFEYDRDDFMKRAHDVVADMAYQGEEFDDIRAYMEKAEKVADAIENMEESQVVVTYQGEYYDTIEMRPIYFSYDGRTIPLTVRVSPEAAQVLEGVKNKSEYIDTLLIREKKEVKPIK